MEIKEIIELMQAVSENGLTSFKMEEGNLKLSIKKENETKQVVAMAPAGMMPQPMPGMQAQPMPGVQAQMMPGMMPGMQASPMAGMMPAPGAELNFAAAQGLQNPQETAPAQSIESDKVITSPLVGTFYNSPSPEAEVFVTVGDTVKKGQTLGIIEAMKLMNEIESEFDGVVEAVLVGNEEVVEYGQPLFRIR